MRSAAPGCGENEIQALLEGTFRRLGGSRPGYGSIVGSGPNATILHYMEDSRVMQDGELLLVDAGAAKLFGPGLGHVVENMRAAGYDPAQVDTVIVTHLHGDHIGGERAAALVVFEAPGLTANQIADFYGTSAQGANRTTITGVSTPEISGRSGYRLNTMTGDRVQTVVVWPSATSDVVNVVITNDLPDPKIESAVEAFGGR